MTLDIHPQLLRSLLAVFEAGSLTAAAERLGYTQSALSKQIASLEQMSGAPLVLRRARGVEPTEAGRRLTGRARTILDQLDAVERELRTLTPVVNGSVSLGGFPATAARLAPAAMARLRVSHPLVQVEFVESSTPVQLRRLRAGRLDLALVAAGDDLPEWSATGLELEELPTGRLRVAVSEDHELARRAHLTRADLAHQVWISGRGAPGEPQFGAWPTLANPTIGARLTEWSARLGFVAAGLGVTTIPSLFTASLPPGVVTVEVHDPTLSRRSLLLAYTGILGPAAASLREAIVREAGHIAQLPQ